MDAQAFRSPLAKFALALWMGCLHWPLTIPFVCALPLLPRSSKGRTQAWSMLMLFALGWTANSVQEAFDPLLTAPKTAKWTCKRNAGANARKPQFTCVNTVGNAYTVEAEVAPPLHSSFLGTLWPFRSASWRRFKHSQGVHGTIRATLPHTLPAETTSEQNLPNLVVAQRLSLRRSLWAYCAVGLALIPWIGWQAHHRIAVGFSYGLVIDGASSIDASMVTHARDSTRLVVQKAAIGANSDSHAVLISDPLAKHAADTWAISPSRNAGFGQIKSRPFAWKRMDGSTIRFNYGADTVHLGQWNRPAFIE